MAAGMSVSPNRTSQERAAESTPLGKKYLL